MILQAELYLLKALKKTGVSTFIIRFQRLIKDGPQDFEKLYLVRLAYGGKF
jgi:hypothetical protein